VSSGDTGDWIGMPFGMVSGVGLGMGKGARYGHIVAIEVE